MREPEYVKKIIHCWKQTRHLEAWDNKVQREAINANVYGELFGGQVYTIDDDEDGNLGVAILDDAPVQGLSDEATFEIVKDFISFDSVPNE